MQLPRKVLLAKIALWCVGTIAFVAYALSVAFLLRSMAVEALAQPEIMRQTEVAKPVQIIAPEQGIPVRLSIPTIAVDAPVDSVGIGADGAMDIKKNPDLTAWYNLGSRPGNSGSAVIAGHYGWEKGKGSVFNELHSLNRGDKIYVIDDRGATISFIVRESRSYDPAADATVVFRSNDGKAHLNLITCEGAWNNKQQTYSSRLVVFADKE